MNGNTIRTITIRGQSEGLDKLTADVNKLAAAQENVAIVSEQSAKRVLSLEDAWKRQTMRLDEAARAQANIARETKVADAALREGLATQAQHAQRLEQINQRYSKTADATKVVTHQTGLARHELVNLGRQAQDVGVSLMSGQSPFTVLVQQGTQIADVFATSGGTVRGFFSQATGWAKTFFTSTTGIVTGVLAVGAAAVYAASQFRTASTTIEEALEEQNRLLKEGKTLLDAKASAESKAFAQSKELTQFQSAANQRDLAAKLDTAKSALVKGVTRPTAGGMPEMGIAPDFETAFTAASGYEKLHAAIVAVSASLKTGQPGVIAFRDEIARLATLNPELTATVQELLKTTQAAAGLEQAAQKAKAVSDALAGIATNAQLAAVGLGSIAQFNLSKLQGEQAAAATERMAVATLQLAREYPGISIEIAKQIDALNDQVKLNEARVNGTEEVTQAEIAYKNAIRQGASELEAQELGRATRRAADFKNQQTHMDMMIEDERELGQEVENTAQAAQQYNQAIIQQNQYLNEQKAIYDDIVEAIGFAAARSASFNAQTGVIDITRFGNSQYWQKNGQDTQFNPAGYGVVMPQPMSPDLSKQYEAMYGSGGFTVTRPPEGISYREPTLGTSVTPTSQGLAFALSKTIDAVLGRSGSVTEAFNTTLTQFSSGLNEAIQPMQQLIELAPKDQQQSMIQAAIDSVRKQPATLEQQLLLKQLTDKMEGLANSTDALNATMQSALSPYYSQDPRTTKLGFRAGVVGNPDWMVAGNANPLGAILGAGATAPGMAGGGSFIVGGGYSSTDNRIAQFPVASGEQVVVNRRPGGQPTVVHNDNRIIIQGSVDQDTLSKLKISRYQQSQRARSSMSAA